MTLLETTLPSKLLSVVFSTIYLKTSHFDTQWNLDFRVRKSLHMQSIAATQESF